MLTQLTPEQIGIHWNTLKIAIEGSLPPIAEQRPDRMNMILQSCLAGETDVFVQHKDDEGFKLLGAVLTRFTHDTASGTKNLMIYCLYNYRPMTDEEWEENLITLQEYARNTDCNRIVAYTKDPRMLQLANKFGADTSYTFVSLTTRR